MIKQQSGEMNELARQALLKLLRSADKHVAGISSRSPKLVGQALTSYHKARSLRDKEDFEAAMTFAEDEGAVKVQRPRFDPTGMIERIDLVDIGQLARILGDEPHSSRVGLAQAVIEPQLEIHPVLRSVLDRWTKLKLVRGYGPSDAPSWLDACTVIAHCRQQVQAGVMETPVRDVSARIFQDSKRIESLIPILDVLLTASLDDKARGEREVLQELGLYREQQPVRVAGDVVLRRERGSFPLDRPYCALPAEAVLALDSTPGFVLSIENLTTFHVMARQMCDANRLIIYTAGMPSPSWCAMYYRVLKGLPEGIPVYHWGDLDEGGFRIAAHISRIASDAGHKLLPWKMSPEDVPEAQLRPANAGLAERMAKFACDAGWQKVAAKLIAARVVAEQEG
ncbi:Wadjet anti-phage system protein JetD domain-containing protein [Achromobacter xylosoxidans]|uniref:Wadjet anti-phage system protein JetD domain-containing protein n=1 Tax=Alcaligenes xylosoxydans xylosoxydans TaxID=85698 RepID=UPI001F13319F|nr:Wadjet anti-phage system protein JetD domain-containing protein [Achromobacter xylosoxidans]